MLSVPLDRDSDPFLTFRPGSLRSDSHRVSRGSEPAADLALIILLSPNETRAAPPPLRAVRDGLTDGETGKHKHRRGEASVVCSDRVLDPAEAKENIPAEQSADRSFISREQRSDNGTNFSESTLDFPTDPSTQPWIPSAAAWFWGLAGNPRSVLVITAMRF